MSAWLEQITPGTLAPLVLGIMAICLSMSFMVYSLNKRIWRWEQSWRRQLDTQPRPWKDNPIRHYHQQEKEHAHTQH